MPFYEYQCVDCGHRIEVLQKISDEPLAFCPQCSESSLKKLVSAAAFRLKGSGWYETDFKHNGKQKEGAQKENVSAEKSSDLKTESSGSSDKSSDKNGNTRQPNKDTKDTSTKDAPAKGTSSDTKSAASAA